ncbi:Unknown protein, partial [Striga hermonthica]
VMKGIHPYKQKPELVYPKVNLFFKQCYFVTCNFILLLHTILFIFYKCRQQSGGVERGYFVMRYMLEIITLDVTNNFDK